MQSNVQTDNIKQFITVFVVRMLMQCQDNFGMINVIADGVA